MFKLSSKQMIALHVLIGLFLIILAGYELYIKQNGGDPQSLFMTQDILMYTALVLGVFMLFGHKVLGTK